MALATKCQTPGAQFTTHVTSAGVMIGVMMPEGTTLDLTEEEAAIVEANLHNALELVLAPYFKK